MLNKTCKLVCCENSLPKLNINEYKFSKPFSY